MNGDTQKITIIGIGRLGGALAIALSRIGFQIENLFVRNAETAKTIAGLIPETPKISTDEDYSKIESDIVLITTQDSEIEIVAEKLENKLGHQSILLHTSGSLSSKILQKSQYLKIGSIHPLVSISDSVIGSETFCGAYFAVEGDDNAVDAAKRIVEKLGGKPLSIDTGSKALYHASAVMACGHIVALLDAANEMLAHCGVEKGQTQNVLMPLIESTISNLRVQNASEALTGTFARLDTEAFERHLSAMGGVVSAEIIELYLQLGFQSLHLVKATESNRKKLSEMKEKISLAKRNLKC